ncbi:hypothetical protein VFPPC_15509 [Pochonia chlamydosporia 170]|uniref:Uncharacterized protein n=1 Tax=Pochonia chlamydosporia 170 TaxID=1380566 RepID=A0A179FY83_METCM|nr:hypothetical protein VFPPC_15509 [Pochonia chlamydosporia 170]OAQ69919.1 hypothetical protein VFPPC_15509 [Pochonia chlamydosporia 170]
MQQGEESFQSDLSVAGWAHLQPCSTWLLTAALLVVYVTIEPIVDGDGGAANPCSPATKCKLLHLFDKIVRIAAARWASTVSAGWLSWPRPGSTEWIHGIRDLPRLSRHQHS